MKERPILFAPNFAQAAHTGGMTQTRRVVMPKEPLLDVLPCQGEDAGRMWVGMTRREPEPRGVAFRCRYGQPGDRLWVREAFLLDPPRNGEWDDKCGEFRAEDVPEEYRHPRHVLYKATWTGQELQWRPSIHMPRWASRLTLEICDVRVERVNAISADDAAAEGVAAARCGGCSPTFGCQQASGPGGRCEVFMHGYKEAFRTLWDSLNAKRPGCSWDEGPWVWVIRFERVTAD